ncbi:succinate dehydrogenase cytochrome b subunit [Flavobacteriales bacterium]|nr:succinate dehydrogenase cytochrome b subunit [Flavobacteriales bacterium]
MSISAILKSSIAKKWLMALTGLFLCLFLVGHLLGNLQLFIGGWDGTVKFNEYAEFMSSNPIVQTVAWITKILIGVHVVLALLLVINNRSARSTNYTYNRPDKNAKFSSRTMGWMGTLLLVFIVVHLINFWAPMHYDNEFPVQLNEAGNYYTADGIEQVNSYLQKVEGRQHVFINKTDMGLAMRDLAKVTKDFFSKTENGVTALLMMILYAIAMLAVAFHLSHGFASAFQSLGINHKRYNGMIKLAGMAFSFVVPFVFAAIPIYLYVTQA